LLPDLEQVPGSPNLRFHSKHRGGLYTTRDQGWQRDAGEWVQPGTDK
jgi:hypothetical protein